jgi:6-phosphogluconolactonase (cycloisomerase 2 family)
LPAPEGRLIVSATRKSGVEMLNRRNVTTLLAGVPLAALAGGPVWAAGTIPFYASAGPKLTLYGLDVASATLTSTGSITLPANIQYAWPHPGRKILYIVASNTQPGSGPMGMTGADKNHYAIAYTIGPDGALSEHGPRRTLVARPLHVSTDHAGRYLFIAYNVPSRVTVHHLNSDGTIGEEVAQDPKCDFGIYAHQVRMTPGDKTLILCSRGNDPAKGKPEDPGHIEVLAVKDGKLSNLQTIKPGASGLGFGPRHLDFHPNGRFVYVSLERENSIAGWHPDGGTAVPEKRADRSARKGKTSRPGRGTDPCPSQWPLCLPDQSRLGDQRGGRAPDRQWRGK